MPQTVLYLSPHLDDVVLSCAARILNDVRRGDRVVVATVFSDGDSSASARERYRARQGEDRAALTLLGAQAVWLGLPDAPYRRDYYHTFREIVLEPHTDDALYAPEIAMRLDELFHEFQPAMVLAPLGAIGHIDHRLVVDAVAEARLPNVVHYEDRPYCFVQHAVRLRLAEIGVSALAPDLEPLAGDQCRAEFLADLDRWHWLDTYLPAGAERLACARILARGFDASALHRAPHVRHEWEVVTAHESTLHTIISAAEHYRSQLPDLFAGREDFVRAAKHYARRIGTDAAYAERYWRQMRVNDPTVLARW